MVERTCQCDQEITELEMMKKIMSSLCTISPIVLIVILSGQIVIEGIIKINNQNKTKHIGRTYLSKQDIGTSVIKADSANNEHNLISMNLNTHKLNASFATMISLFVSLIQLSFHIATSHTVRDRK